MQLALLTPEQMPMSIIHKFESAGLGKAPFRVTGMSEKRCSGQPNAQGVTVGSPGQPCGTCDYCGTGIANCYEITSSDGKTSIVGSDCVAKTGDTGMIDLVKRAENKRKTVKRHETEKSKIEEMYPLFQAAIQSEASKPHPWDSYSKDGFTMADYLQSCWNVSGASGRLKLIKTWCK